MKRCAQCFAPSFRRLRRFKPTLTEVACLERATQASRVGQVSNSHAFLDRAGDLIECRPKSLERTQASGQGRVTRSTRLRYASSQDVELGFLGHLDGWYDRAHVGCPIAGIPRPVGRIIP